MNRDLLKNFTPSTRRALEALAGSPEDAVAFLDRLTIFRASLRIGVEIMEQAIKKTDNGPGNFACMAAIGATTAIECTMSLLEELHPEIGKRKVGSEPDAETPRAKSDGMNGERFRGIDLD